MVTALVGYALVAITFAHFQVRGDGLVYFNLLRRFFGEHPDSAFAYQFGSDYWNAPFFLAAKGLSSVFGSQPRIFHVSFQEVSITFAANAALIATIYLGWRLLRELDLPRGPLVLLLTVFGTPLFYYTLFEPSSKHAVDTLVITAGVLMTYSVQRGGDRRAALALGALAGLAVNIRYVNIAFFGVIFIALAIRQKPAAVRALATACVVAPLLFVVPALRGVDYFLPSYFPKSDGGARVALSAQMIIGGVENPLNGFDPLIPVKMLISLHRGLFLWTPLTALAALGFGLWFHRRKDDDDAAFQVTLLAASLALLLVHTIWGQWDGGFAFSQRFLTSLFPLYLIGVAELRRRYSQVVYAALIACVVWSVAIAFVHDIGYDDVSERDGVDRIAGVMVRSHTHLRHEIDGRAVDRWSYLWGLLHGRDPEHVHGL
jgi:hypothetical protein